MVSYLLRDVATLKAVRVGDEIGRAIRGPCTLLSWKADQVVLRWHDDDEIERQTIMYCSPEKAGLEIVRMSDDKLVHQSF